MIIKSTDVWTEQYPNHYECLNGAFIDGIENNSIPFDRYKVILNCNCIISSNSPEIIVGNKHNAIVFYKNDQVVRLAVLTNKTDVFSCLENALNQKYESIKLKDLFAIKNIAQEVIDMKETPIFNKCNNVQEMDIGSCDRISLLNCMLNGDYTESKTTFGNYDCNEYDFYPDIDITYALKTNKEVFEIPHKGAFINKTKTRAIIIQTHGSISLEKLEIKH